MPQRQASPGTEQRADPTFDPAIDLAHQVGAELSRRGQTLATAESCTGGLIGYCMTDVPGSSDYYLGGVVAYANEAKIALLGVSTSTLDASGAVSAQVAVEMAEGARRKLGSDVAISVTGIAGPGGGGPGKPVGLVYIAVAAQGISQATKHQFGGGRLDVRTAAAEAALRTVLTTIQLGAE